VFDIICLKNAAKQITVRSSVTVENTLDFSIEARLESLIESGMRYV